MCPLNEEIIAAFPKHFEAVHVCKEREIKTFENTRVYLTFEFSTPIRIPVVEESIGPLIDNLAACGKSLSVQHHTELRWVGNPAAHAIDIQGVVLSITAKHFEANEHLFKPLLDSYFIQADQIKTLLVKVNHALQLPAPKHNSFSRLFYTPRESNHTVLNQGKQLIRTHVSALKEAQSTRSYVGECATNHAYENLSQVSYQLALNEKRIWVLRENFEIVLGIKNAYQGIWGYHGIHDAFDEKNHPYINWDDRLGHPSLVLSNPGDESGVYYAGHLAQREGYIEVLNNSGRFDRSDLSREQLEILEAYVALELQRAFGNQKIVFIPRQQRNTYDADYFELSIFFQDQHLASQCLEKREYTQNIITNILTRPPNPLSRL